jgi:hypothetical protein
LLQKSKDFSVGNDYFSPNPNAPDLATRDHAVRRGATDMNRLGELKHGVPSSGTIDS